MAAFVRRKLTDLLHQMADGLSEIVNPETGEAMLRSVALADLLWKKALGYDELVEDDRGIRNVRHQPEAWAINLIYDRIEGKVPIATDDLAIGTGGKVVDKVTDITKIRLNALAAAAAEVAAKKPLPPKVQKRGDDGNTGTT